MKVYTLTGKSGTGKSFQAINLCKELNIESLIDDGLFIYKNHVEAGVSAKRQSTSVGAIKTALFSRDDHRDQVLAKIKSLNPSAILIIGTSDRMVDRIVDRLNLPAISKRVYIEDITTEEERETADKQRHIQGKHVIPVPTLQLKRDFAGYFMDPLRIFRGFGSSGKEEKTVVRPTFSYMGEFYISDSVMNDIADCVAKETPGVYSVIKVYENTSPDTLKVKAQIAIKRNVLLWRVAEEYQKSLAREVETMTAFNVVRVDVEVKEIV